MATLYIPPAATVDVGTKAVQVVPAQTGRPSIDLYNNGPAAVYIGIDNTVTSATGTVAPMNTVYTDTTAGALWACVAGDEGNAALSVLVTPAVSDVSVFTANSIPFYDASGNLSQANPGLTWAPGVSLGDGNGGTALAYYTSELITLSTSGTTTDSVGNLLPAGAIIWAVTARVVTTIATATDWSVGDAVTAARFSAANSTLAAGTTSVGLAQMAGNITTVAAGPTQAAAAKVRITTTGTPSAGVVRVTVWYQQFTAPTA